MKKSNNIISDWLDKYGDPEIDKKVEMKLEDMNKERFNQIIDEVYNKYLTKYVGYDDVPSKKLFLFEIKNNKEFSERWGLKIGERELSFDERVEYFKKTYPGKWDEYELPKDNFSWYNIPTKQITLEYNGTKIEIYER